MDHVTIQKLLSNISAKYEAVVEKAYDFAFHAHGDQKRDGGEPYIVHPLAVAYFLSTLHLDGNTLAAALLHDVLEDTPVKQKELEKEFGKEITFLVDSVTKISAITYQGKADIQQKQNLKAQTLRKMIFAMAKDLRVVLIKLSDRYNNVQTLQKLSAEKSHRIALETLEIYAPIAERLGMGHLKGELEDLSFPFVFPEEYEWLTKQVKEPRQERISYLENLIPKLKKIVENKGTDIVNIHSRAKHYFSLYRKIISKDMDISRVYDLIALRVIVPDIESCYSAMGTIHTFYKPLPGLIKDYIALPRPNGYQSLHTTVFCEEGKVVEIQIRTPEMHEYAENGIAAHWAYSESGKQKDHTAHAHDIEWVKKMQEMVKGAREQEFVKDLKIDFFKHRIFIFTPKGDIIDLPEGATPIDAAFEIHSDLGNSCAGAKVNGKMVSLSYELKNGDIVEIIKSKQAHPSQDWLMIAKTSIARRKIKSWLLKNGKAEIKKVEILKLPVKKQTKSKKESNYPSESSIIVGGQDKITTKIAGCCKPQAPQMIVGYITKSQKISIHSSLCSHVGKFSKNRIISAEWASVASFIKTFVLKIDDRIGMLRDISEIFARLKINIKEVKNIPAEKGASELKIILEIKNANQLKLAQKKLKSLSGVKSVKKMD